MRPRRWWWVVFGAGAVVVMLGLVWVTVTVVRLERAELRARTDAVHQEALRLALWRLDSWLAPLLAREAARPYFDYQPFFPQQRAYTAVLDPIEPGEVVTASPLLSFESVYFSLHFQMAPDGSLTSPQSPRGEYRDLAAGAYLSEAQLIANSERLSSIDNLVTPRQVQECVAAADVAADTIAEQTPIPLTSPWQRAQRAEQPQQQLNRQELTKRRGNVRQAVAAGRRNLTDQPKGADETVVVGALVPFWSNDAGGVELIFTRSVRIGDAQYFQGFVCDWPALRDALLEQVTDLFAAARLVPVIGPQRDDDPGGTMLATIPVDLDVPRPVPLAAGFVTPARSTLAVSWLAVLAGIAGVAVSLRASIAYGVKRSRFASAVTHELRTPLTTFRMYSEMLAEGMITDPEQRQTYLETLRDESGRLSAIVENVLAYARLEEGRRTARSVTTTVAAVMDEVVANLQRRAVAGGLELLVEGDHAASTPLSVDVEAVGQILYNLVDNACKYAADAHERTIHLTVERRGTWLVLAVRDHGPGVPDGMTVTIFDAFDRGARNEGDPTPGVGLGLALARGLARDMGGDVSIRPRPGDDQDATGACFELTLPLG